VNPSASSVTGAVPAELLDEIPDPLLWFDAAAGPQG
jgi:hypothetical protein